MFKRTIIFKHSIISYNFTSFLQKINLNHNFDALSKIYDEVLKRTSKEVSNEYYDNTDTMYQASMMLPYLYPQPGVYYPLPAPLNTGYYPGNEMPQPQYPQAVNQPPSPIQPVPPPVLINQPSIDQPDNTQFTSAQPAVEVQQVFPTMTSNPSVPTIQTDRQPVNSQPNNGIPLSTIPQNGLPSGQQSFGKPVSS